MAISDAINSIKTHLTEAWDAVHEKGGASAGNDNLENLASAIATLSGGIEIDFKSHPDAYVGIAGLTSAGGYEVVYLTDSAAVEAMCSNEGYNFSALNITPVKLAFSELVETLDITSIGDDFLGYAGPQEEGQFNRPALSLVSIEGLEHFTKVTVVGDRFLRSSGDRSTSLALQHLSGFPPNVEAAGMEFFTGHPAFNEALVLPAQLSSVGTSSLCNLLSFNQPFALPQSLTNIGDYSFQNWQNFNQPFAFPTGLTTIGDNVMNGMTAFNQPLVLPDTLEHIGSGFMHSAYSFAQPLVIPASVAYIGDQFMQVARNFTGPLTINTTTTPENNYGDYSLSTDSETDPLYATGVTVEGAGADAWRAALPASKQPYNYRFLVGQERPMAYATWKDSNGNSMKINSKAELLNFCNGNEPSNLKEIHFTEKCQSVTEDEVGSLSRFMYNSSSVTTITGLENFTQVYTIGSNFLFQVRALVGPLQLPPNIHQVGAGFMDQVKAFTGPLFCTSQVAFVNTESTLRYYDDRSPSASGIHLQGEYAAQWKAALPDITGASPGRILIVDTAE